MATKAGSSGAAAAGETPSAASDATLDEARALLARAEDELHAIERAIERLEDGTYFTCELCGSPIAPERLAAVPTERSCEAHGAPD
jgi:RNA polymerase-binding transcription factor DksA